MRLIICLPTYNEELSIQYMIDELRKHNFDFFVCDAGSTDKTVSIAKENGVEVYGRDGQGKGFGILKALQVAKQKGADFVGFTDCDGTYPVEAFNELVAIGNNADMVIASRGFAHLNFRARIAYVFFNNLVNLLFRSKYRDVNSGMRVIRVAKFEGKLNAKGFDTEAEMCCLAVTNNYKCLDFEIPYFERIGETKVRNIVFFQIAIFILRYWWKKKVFK